MFLLSPEDTQNTSIGKFRLYIIFTVFIFAASTALIFYLRIAADQNNDPDVPVIPEITESAGSDNISDHSRPIIIYNNYKITYQIYEIIDRQISLIPNFTAKLTTTEIIDRFKCNSLINGAFYTQDNKPLGLLYTNSQLIRPAAVNRLINGFLWQDETGAFAIDYNEPAFDAVWILQTGPVLYDGEALKLAIKNDKPARRIAAAVSTERGQLYFIALYDIQNTYSGPLLADTPDILAQINGREKLSITRAVNLDGGSASAFITDKLRLTEISYIGSAFCIK